MYDSLFITTSPMHTIAVIGQIIFGVYWVYQGYNHLRHSTMLAGYAASKGTPQPKLAVIGTGILMLLGGVGILLGVHGTALWISILALVIFLIPTTFMIHNFWKATDPMAKMSDRIQFEKNLALLGALFILWSMSTLAYSLM